MNPALSVIVFTTSSGAGFGLLFWLGLWPAPAALIESRPLFGWAAFVLGFGLAVGGLLSSTFHLGHPERAWRAFGQWRSSWLSREGVLAVAALLVFGLYAMGWLFLGQRWAALGWLGALLSTATVYATGMIYGQLRTVPRWHTPLTSACYLAFAAAGGALALATLLALFAAPVEEGAIRLVLALLVAAWAVKILWWRRGDAMLQVTTPETATGLGDIGRVRLLEPPHTGSNYLLDEMGYRVARRHAAKLRLIAVALGGITPLAFVALAWFAAPAGLWLLLALAAHLAGVLAERWLFFAEATHVVTNYYDRRMAAE